MKTDRLLRPRSIAIVGASDTVGPGFNAWKALEHVGFEGQVHLVNPNKPELFGRKTYASLNDIDSDVDAVFVAVAAHRVLEVADQAIARNAGALAIMSSGFSDAGEAGVALQQELTARANAHQLAVCGPNCLGLLNFSARSALFGTSLPDRVERGNIAAVVQSGSIGIALLNSARGLGLSHMITSGNEAVTTTADYLEALIEDDAVKTVIIFAEQIRKPAKFMEMVKRAGSVGKPVIVLKSGRSERGQAAVMAHTGAVAGSVEACDAALAASGAIQVFTLDELLETAALVSQLRGRPTATGVGAMSLSGGEIALALDAIDDAGVTFPALGKAAEDTIAGLMPEYAHLSNPLDLTWAGLYDANVAEGCARALGSQPDVGSLLLLQDAPTGLGAQQAGRYATLLQAVARGAEAAGKPLIALSNLSDDPHPDLKRAAQSVGVPYLRGTREALSALARYSRWATRPAAAPLPTTSPKVITEVNAALDQYQTRMPAEHEARDMLAGYGVTGPEERFVQTAQEAADAAGAIGFPVVLKCMVVDMVHKSDAGFVRLKLATPDAVRDAAEDMLTRARAAGGGAVLGLLVQKMAAPVAEILVGARVDPDFGPLIVVGAGGIHVELYKDVAIRIAPISETEALAALESTKAARILDGFRGSPPADKAAVARMVSNLSRFIADFADRVKEVEINPLAVFENGKGCAALDCVIVPNTDQS